VNPYLPLEMGTGEDLDKVGRNMDRDTNKEKFVES
jgi:hypothetical protein